ncbi:MAG: hypothetical protein IJ985_05995, partial [Akkermansia sp.]|nr:hypothetical protein [Akkermansia sp.]
MEVHDKVACEERSAFGKGDLKITNDGHAFLVDGGTIFINIMSGCQIGEDCNIGQNVVVSPGVVLGRNCKIQNNVSIY